MGTFVTVGASGRIYTSEDAEGWTLQSNPFGSSYINALAYGGGFLVAMGDAGKSATSTDAINWTANTSLGAFNHLYAIAYDGAGLFVAVGAGGKIFTSPDGMAWTERVSPFSSSTYLHAVTYANGLWIVGGGGSQIATSTDGLTWSSLITLPGTAYAVRALGYGNGLYVAVTESGKICTSSNGTSWTARTSNTTWDLYAIGYAGAQFVAVGGETVTSPDGTTWTNRGWMPAESWVRALTHDGSQWIAVGDNGTVAISTDGAIWTQQPGTGGGALYDLVYAADIAAPVAPVSGTWSGDLAGIGADWIGAVLTEGTFSVNLAGILPTFMGYLPPTGQLTAALGLANLSASGRYLLVIPATRGERFTYTLMLTGQPSLNLPLASFQARRRDGEPTFLSCVVPNGMAYAEAIEARLSGELIINMNVHRGDVVNSAELVRAALETMMLYEGAHSNSVVLNARMIQTNSVPKVVLVEEVSYRAQTNGRHRLRCAINFDLQPGDIVRHDALDFVAREISYAVSPMLSLMEVIE